MSEVELYPGRVSPLGLRTIPHCDISRYTGLELLQRIIDNKYPAPPNSFQLSFDLTEVSEGRAVFRGLPNERYLNPLGGCMAAGPRHCWIRLLPARCKRCSTRARSIRRRSSR